MASGSSSGANRTERNTETDEEWLNFIVGKLKALSTSSSGLILQTFNMMKKFDLPTEELADEVNEYVHVANIKTSQIDRDVAQFLQRRGGPAEAYNKASSNQGDDVQIVDHSILQDAREFDDLINQITYKLLPVRNDVQIVKHSTETSSNQNEDVQKFHDLDNQIACNLQPVRADFQIVEHSTETSSNQNEDVQKFKDLIHQIAYNLQPVRGDVLIVEHNTETSNQNEDVQGFDDLEDSRDLFNQDEDVQILDASSNQDEDVQILDDLIDNIAYNLQPVRDDVQIVKDSAETSNQDEDVQILDSSSNQDDDVQILDDLVDNIPYKLQPVSGPGENLESAIIVIDDADSIASDIQTVSGLSENMVPQIIIIHDSESEDESIPPKRIKKSAAQDNPEGPAP